MVGDCSSPEWCMDKNTFKKTYVNHQIVGNNTLKFNSMVTHWAQPLKDHQLQNTHIVLMGVSVKLKRK